KQRLDFERELERSVLSGLKESAAPADSGRQSVAPSVPSGSTQPTASDTAQGLATGSSAEYLHPESKRNQLWFATALLVLLSWVAGLAYFLNQRRGIDSLAVLPFVQAEKNLNIEYLGDDLTNGLIHNLTRLPNLYVKPFSSISRYKGKEIDPAAVGNELKVKS